ncbi:ArsR/SmtB family transcription factor [Aurantiacibacter spongiae]|uniref:Methyltransferase domain-containing protein n=1 Tax=Aurantiacibacter spongiae TaxID=2488860 RepID=A0A3N5CZV9_9SPHN|nr:metalloregulator ArsR/SmtB family transcription factor [Aurantiacibacter spongiae]RPF72269.1 methyltransferase domain-containing protein [Aurantiacibacter spongiae]
MRTETVIRALDDLTRLRIMRLLSHMDLAVGEVAQVLGQSQPRVSRHISILCDCGLVERRREGSWTFLRNTLPPTSGSGFDAAVAGLLCSAEDNDAEFAARCAEDRRHLSAIRSTREKNAAEYFARHADEWDRLSTLLCPGEQVEARLSEALEDAPLGRLLDIGTGTGRIAHLLANSTEHIVGLDRSPEMLRVARSRLQALPSGEWELIQADFGALPFADASFDTVVMHQVLHYASEPALPVAEAARVCRPGGRIAVVDLDAHEREELREQHAHARLGFTDEQIADWFRASGLEPRRPIAMPGQGLTTKIWIAYRAAENGRSHSHATGAAV